MEHITGRLACTHNPDSGSPGETRCYDEHVYCDTEYHLGLQHSTLEVVFQGKLLKIELALPRGLINCKSWILGVAHCHILT